MAVPTAAYIGEQWAEQEGRRNIEYWELTGGAGGSAAADAVTITLKNSRNPQFVEGPVSYTVSGNTVTLALLAALGAGLKVAVRVSCSPGSP